MYVVISEIDWEEMGSFKTKREALPFIKELKQFDKDQHNPFKESYIIIKEDE